MDQLNSSCVFRKGCMIPFLLSSLKINVLAPRLFLIFSKIHEAFQCLVRDRLWYRSFEKGEGKGSGNGGRGSNKQLFIQILCLLFCVNERISFNWFLRSNLNALLHTHRLYKQEEYTGDSVNGGPQGSFLVTTSIVCQLISLIHLQIILGIKRSHKHSDQENKMDM